MKTGNKKKIKTVLCVDGQFFKSIIDIREYIRENKKKIVSTDLITLNNGAKIVLYITENV